MRYDACVIGAGADGLAAAAALAKAGLKTVVIERNAMPGGRCATREFHPGFRASPFCDELAPVPAQLFWSLDLGRRGALFAPTPSAAVWPDRVGTLAPEGAASRLLAEASRLRRDAFSRALADAQVPPPRHSFYSRKPPAAAPWPGEAWESLSLAGLLGTVLSSADAAAHVTALTLAGRATDPELGGSALHLLVPGSGGSGVVVGGLGMLADALAGAARDAGAAISTGIEATDIRRRRSRASGVGLSDGTELEARAIVSTLDLKRTFLSLFQWSDLSPPLVKRSAGFRMGGGTARVLLALSAPPKVADAIRRGPLCVAPDAGALSTALAACRSGALPETPPAILRLVSAADPRLAPAGAAVLTVTLGCIPLRLFDGAWTKEKRDLLLARALDAAERVMPGARALAVGADIITPPDIEDALGATDGDLWGGEIAPDQMFGFRPFGDMDVRSPPTPIDGLYLAGPSSAAGLLGTCAAGAVAAAAVIADAKAGRLP